MVGKWSIKDELPSKLPPGPPELDFPMEFWKIVKNTPQSTPSRLRYLFTKSFSVRTKKKKKPLCRESLVFTESSFWIGLQSSKLEVTGTACFLCSDKPMSTT